MQSQNPAGDYVCYPRRGPDNKDDYHGNLGHRHDISFVSVLLGPSSTWCSLLRALLLPVYRTPFVFSNSAHHLHEIEDSWQGRASFIMINLLHCLGGPLRTFNWALEWLLNFLQSNGGVSRILLLLALGQWGDLIWIPPKDSPAYLTVVGWLDTRLDLLDPAAEFKETNSKSFVDLCVMASKLVYESPHVQREVLETKWKMCFRTFLDCWNDRAQRNTTEAFIFTDKPEKANLIFVAFRGTEPFDADDWSIDFDFSWLEPDPEVGKIHLGFLEALGLVNRNQCATFDKFKQNCLTSCGTMAHNQYSQTTGLKDQEGGKTLAFDAINKELRRLLRENPDAHVFLTGHSLGGALALVFAGVLMYKKSQDREEDIILERLSAIHTFGQPRVGDRVFAEFLNNSMKAHKIDYYRIVYSSDMISRIPFDNEIFGFKHAGNVCYYYDSSFSEKVVEEVPNKNFFSPSFALRMWVTAMWELSRSVLLMTLMYGAGFKETILMIMLRVFGLVFPGLLAHMPVNYVNAVRLGPNVLLQYPKRKFE